LELLLLDSISDLLMSILEIPKLLLLLLMLEFLLFDFTRYLSKLLLLLLNSMLLLF
jgi:hypothetical protein